MRLSAISFLLFFFSSFTVFSQKSRDELEEEKQANQARIERAQRVLQQTSEKKKSTLGEVKALNVQISSHSRQIALITEDITLIDKEIGSLEKSSADLESKLKNLKREYAEMLYIASKSSGKLNQLSFLFSAKSFNDLVMRYKYLEQYTESRKKQVEQIKEVAAKLEERQKELTAKRSQQESVARSKQTEANKLNALKKKQSRSVAELAKEEKKLRREIANSKKAIAKLDRLITSLVTKSTRESNAAPRNEAVVNTALSKSFAQNKNKLPWPVRSGFISDRFGVKDHPILKNVKVDNNGVDIQTSPNARVSAVFGGVVLDISQIPGLNNVVAVQHGEYYTIYANLASVNVSINQELIAGQLIGIAGQKDGEYEINFQVWHQFEKQNPESWLARK
ncbi:peptidoglycan DD-metalloendopeptidase family protein [Marinilongibacter aquaticus]|uniref:murein hydrolase activator EnvC family protein n=1 Tax=Marinilongibacter aquaticus TaxID=2975157 RepID=UPI0021BD2CEA|nr:peptidoglycan DD-metalloendopeptidase family protein [Marinilongibacter aquaticus]UBM57729.1 peptidoglycan DD-metalloendopeptidase family protein [Marinilongibacter aquaticus]